MISISLCMIVRDEEKTLTRCLESVKDIVDEIIIIDTGSVDKTKEIAYRFTQNVFDFKWIDDFSTARNYSFSKATMDYIFWMDADDVLLEDDRLKLKSLKESLNSSVDIVMMKYNLGIKEDGTPILSFYRERLLKRSMNFKWEDPIHEYIDLKGNIVNSDICITHKKEHGISNRNLNIFKKMIAEGRELSKRNHFYYARELYINKMFDDAVVYYNKFLEFENQYVSNYLDSCIDLSNIYKFKGDMKKSLQALLRSFEYTIPRAEICCKIGYHFKQLKDYEKAIYWFSFATKLEKPSASWGFIIHDCWDFVPCIELSACYYNMGDILRAIKFNEMAGEYKPNHPVVLQNRKFFISLIK